MNKKRIIKRVLIIFLIIGAIGSAIALYMFNMPHRNVRDAKVDFTLSSGELVNEFLTDSESAYAKYLDESGDSKILAISGIVQHISEDLARNKVIVIKTNEADYAGVSCTFLPESNHEVEKLNPGELITIKGVFRSGAAFDQDLNMYENIILEKCSLL